MANKHKTLVSLFSDIADAIREKTGGADSIVADDFPEAIAAIRAGGAVRSDVNLIDYDGTIVHSYTAAEFAALTALPDNPSHEGLTAQGWNWTLSDAQSYVASYGKLWVGQMYITDDGKTRVYITLQEGRISPTLGIGLNGTATIDWGDGNTSTVEGSSVSTVVNTQHIYAAAGDYVIAISVSGSMAIVASSTNSTLLWKNSTTAAENRVYEHAISGVEIGENCSIGNSAFGNCYGMRTVTLPESITSIGTNAFYTCCSLVSITIPRGVTSIGGNFTSCGSLRNVSVPNGIKTMPGFYGCAALEHVAVPASVTSLGGSAFYLCCGLAEVTIPGTVTSISTYAFYGCYDLEAVHIPSGITSLGSNVLSLCYSLASITIPNTVTSIAASAFGNCYGLSYIKFERSTPPTVANSNTWANIPTDCIIYVPSSALTAYQNATNYPSSGTYTYVGY